VADNTKLMPSIDIILMLSNDRSSYKTNVIDAEIDKNNIILGSTRRRPTYTIETVFEGGYVSKKYLTLTKLELITTHFESYNTKPLEYDPIILTIERPWLVEKVSNYYKLICAKVNKFFYTYINKDLELTWLYERQILVFKEINGVAQSSKNAPQSRLQLLLDILNTVFGIMKDTIKLLQANPKQKDLKPKLNETMFIYNTIKSITGEVRVIVNIARLIVDTCRYIENESIKNYNKLIGTIKTIGDITGVSPMIRDQEEQCVNSDQRSCWLRLRCLLWQRSRTSLSQ